MKLFYQCFRHPNANTHRTSLRQLSIYFLIKRTLEEINSCLNRPLVRISLLFSYLPSNSFSTLNLLKPNHQPHPPAAGALRSPAHAGREQSKRDLAPLRLFRQSHRTLQWLFLPLTRSGLQLSNESNRCGSQS